jgi:SAM-dependent methyltransferase
MFSQPVQSGSPIDKMDLNEKEVAAEIKEDKHISLLQQSVSRDHFEKLEIILKKIVEEEVKLAGIPSLNYIHAPVIQELSIQNSVVKCDDKSLIKLRLITQYNKNDHIRENYKNPCYDQNVLYLRFEDGSKIGIRISNKHAGRLSQHLKLLGAKGMYPYWRNLYENINWQHESIQEIYREETYCFYKEEDALIMAKLHQFLKMNNMLDSACNIVDLGCGDGRFLREHISQLKKISWIGIDLNSDNISNAQKYHDGDQNHFVLGNMLDIQKIFQASHLVDHKAPIIITALGSLTRLVLPNGFVAVQVLQALFRMKSVVAVFGGGVAEVLFTKNIAKRIGFHFSHERNPHPLFTLIKIPYNEIISNKVKKIKRRGILDLSLSPIPERLLEETVIKEAIAETKTIVINISHCAWNDRLSVILKEFIKIHKNIKLIFDHSDQKQLTSFRKTFLHCTELIDSSLEKDDIQIMAPKGFVDTVTPYHSIMKSINEIDALVKLKKDLFQDMFLPNLHSEIQKMYIIFKKLNNHFDDAMEVTKNCVDGQSMMAFIRAQRVIQMVFSSVPKKLQDQLVEQFIHQAKDSDRLEELFIHFFEQSHFTLRLLIHVVKDLNENRSMSFILLHLDMKHWIKIFAKYPIQSLDEIKAVTKKLGGKLFQLAHAVVASKNQPKFVPSTVLPALQVPLYQNSEKISNEIDCKSRGASGLGSRLLR